MMYEVSDMENQEQHVIITWRNIYMSIYVKSSDT